MPMGRPPKWRRVAFIPEITYFKPAGISSGPLEEVCLSVEEAEAVRLKDWEGMGQEQCADKMNISRQTFQRVLGAARRKVADALLHGKAIRIEGGNFQPALQRFRCLAGHEWDVPFEAMTALPPRLCPRCRTPDILPLQPPGPGRAGRGGGGRHWRRHGWQQTTSLERSDENP